MAKKTTAPTAPEVVPGDVEVLELEAEVVPQELMLIKQQYGLTLADEKVDAHIETYTPFFKGLIDLEPEMQDLLTKEVTPETMAEAAALRKKYAKIRINSGKQKKADKEEINAEGKFLDTVDNRIKAAAEVKEKECQEIETKLQNLENERKAALKAERKALLEAQDYDTDFLTLEDMTEESFAKLLSKAETIKQGLSAKAKQDAEEAENQKALAAKKLIRVNQVTALGLQFNEETGDYESEDGEIGAGFLDVASDEEFTRFMTEVSDYRKDRLDAEAAEQKAAKDLQAKITERMTAVSSLGLGYNTGTESYSGYDQTISLEQIKTISNGEFASWILDAREVIDTQKAEEARIAKEKADKEAATLAENKRLKKVEADRLAKEKADKEAKEAQERAALLAPDKDKFKAFYTSLKALKVPEFKAPAAIKAGSVIRESLDSTIKTALQEASKLV